LALFNDKAAADKFQEPDESLRQFADECKLPEHLRGLTGNITHVVIDPAKGKLTGFTTLERYIEIIAAGKLV
jgi:hypothetical protein